MADKKLTTAEILAMARKQAGGGDTSSGQPAVEPPVAPAVESPVPPVSAAPPVAAPPVAAPKSTADILAAARAQSAAKKAESPPPAAATPAAAPKSTADILAAARAQSAKQAEGAPLTAAAAPKSTADILAAGGGATPAPSKAAVSAAPVAATAPAGMDLKEMVAAVKQSQSGQPASPKLPPRPTAPRLPEKEKVTRRTFWTMLAAITITPFAFAWFSLSAVAGLWTLAAARFLMPNMVRELPSKFKVGSLSDFPPGTVSEKYTASRGIWIVNTDQYNGKPLLYALVSVCTHLGCTPSWLSGEQKFKCPCHGSGFYITGVNFEGPAPRPLERAGLALGADGLLEVDKSVKFQEELGQWSDAKSFVELG